MGSSAASPARGEIWGVDLNPTRGREQAGFRPALIISDNDLNSGPLNLVIVLPITGTSRGFPSHVRVEPPDGGLTKSSEVMVEQIRAVAKSRLGKRYGMASVDTMAQVDQILKFVLGL